MLHTAAIVVIVVVGTFIVALLIWGTVRCLRGATLPAVRPETWIPLVRPFSFLTNIDPL